MEVDSKTLLTELGPNIYMKKQAHWNIEITGYLIACTILEEVAEIVIQQRRPRDDDDDVVRVLTHPCR